MTVSLIKRTDDAYATHYGRHSVRNTLHLEGAHKFSEYWDSMLVNGELSGDIPYVGTGRHRLTIKKLESDFLLFAYGRLCQFKNGTLHLV